MPTNDLQIDSRIRAILAGHWIDTQKLHFWTNGGTVRFSGVIVRHASCPACDVDMTVVEVLMNEIRRTPGVRRVYFTGVKVEKRKRSIRPIEAGTIHSYEGARKRIPEPPEPARARAMCYPA